MKKYPPPFELIEQYVFKRADAVFARNEDAKHVLVQKGYHGRIEIVTHGVDTSAFQPTDDPEFRAKLANSNEKIVGYVGTMTKQKGIDTLIKAMQIIPAKLILVGDGPEKTVLQNLADSLKINVTFLPAAKHSEVVKYMNLFDVFVLPSITLPGLTEKFGRVIIEAMASGTPVIGSNSGEIPKVVANAGLIFQEQNVADLRDKINSLLINNSLRQSFASSGMAHVEKMYSWKAVAAKTIQIYRELL